MKLNGPFRYTVHVRDSSYMVVDDTARSKFVAPVTRNCPKLYVFATDHTPIYIGQTRQGMAARVRFGFSANGVGGYHGYRWRRELQSAQLFIWCLEDCSEEKPDVVLECVEAEIVHAHRLKHDQWPKYQTEIHFHQTNATHRELASSVMKYFEDARPSLSPPKASIAKR